MDVLGSLILKDLLEPLEILFRPFRKIAHSSFLFLLNLGYKSPLFVHPWGIKQFAVGMFFRMVKKSAA